MTNPRTIRHLRKRYEKAVADGEEFFKIEGLEFVTDYAKYLLEYIDMRGVPNDMQLRNLFQKVDKDWKQKK